MSTKTWVLVMNFETCALISDCVEEIDAQHVLGYALFKDGKNTRLSYPLEKFNSDVAGRSFHNGRFIQRMIEKAATLPRYSFLLSFFWCSIIKFDAIITP